MEQLREKALRLGASEFGISKAKGKRLYVIYDSKKINFGSDIGSTYIDHKDEKKRKAWKARHTRILKNGKPAYKNPYSASFWSYHILW